MMHARRAIMNCTESHTLNIPPPPHPSPLSLAATHVCGTVLVPWLHFFETDMGRKPTPSASSIHRPRAYKFRFRKWGLRKNIKEHEALEIVSGQRNPNEFWAGTKRVNFERRIARHLEKEGQEVERLSKADLASLASRLSSTGGGPRRMSAPALYEGLESSLYDVNEWLAENRHREDWFSQRLDLGADEHFFPLFTRGLSLLARGDLAQQPTAWHTINRAFDHVRGLIASHHPVVYLRLVGRAAAFKYYPDAPICLDVCRLLLQHAYALFTEMHPTCHLLQAIWQTQMRTLRGTPRGPAAGSMEHSINVVTSLCASQWGDSREAWYMGALCIERYVPSAARGQDEDGLRATLLLEGNSNSNSNSNNNNNSASLDMDVLLSPLSISLAQEARLALGELLIGQERLAEGQRLVEEALAYRDLDVVQTEGKLFWMAELEWRMGHQDASISLLEETLAVLDAVALAQAQEGEAPGAYSSSSSSLTSSSSSSSSSLSALHVLGIMAHRLNIMGRRDYGSAARQRLSCLLNETQRECEYPFTLHLVRFDFEVEMDPEAVKKVLEGI